MLCSVLAQPSAVSVALVYKIFENHLKSFSIANSQTSNTIDYLESLLLREVKQHFFAYTRQLSHLVRYSLTLLKRIFRQKSFTMSIIMVPRTLKLWHLLKITSISHLNSSRPRQVNNEKIHFNSHGPNENRYLNFTYVSNIFDCPREKSTTFS